MNSVPARTVVQQFFDTVLNRQDVSASSQILSPDHVAHFAGMPAPLDLTGLQDVARGYFAAFPNFHLVTQDVIADGDRVAVRWTWSGTHRGEFMGIPASGREVGGAGMGIYHVVDGRIEEQWIAEDMNLLVQQIGPAQP
jgi:steroid delta-isomerase-like uncharacterized protein